MQNNANHINEFVRDIPESNLVSFSGNENEERLGFANEFIGKIQYVVRSSS